MNLDLGLLIQQTLLFFFPAYFANLSPILFSKLGIFGRLFATPIDGGRKLGEFRIFGKNKTVGGLVSGCIGGFIGAGIVILLALITGQYSSELLTPNVVVFYLCFGFLMGFGALAGDLLKSFFKRRLGIAEGSPWWFFDQNDFVVGAWLVSCFMVHYSNTWQMFLLALLLTPPLHLLANYLAYKAKFKKVWW